MNGPKIREDRLFNNADSFAQVFDRCWADHCKLYSDFETAQRLDAVLLEVAEHPFAMAEPDLCRQVALFRIRLLGLC
jgi:hypothetical protein